MIHLKNPRIRIETIGGGYLSAGIQALPSLLLTQRVALDLDGRNLRFVFVQQFRNALFDAFGLLAVLVLLLFDFTPLFKAAVQVGRDFDIDGIRRAVLTDNRVDDLARFIDRPAHDRIFEKLKILIKGRQLDKFRMIGSRLLLLSDEFRLVLAVRFALQEGFHRAEHVFVRHAAGAGEFVRYQFIEQPFRQLAEFLQLLLPPAGRDIERKTGSQSVEQRFHVIGVLRDRFLPI